MGYWILIFLFVCVAGKAIATKRDTEDINNGKGIATEIENVDINNLFEEIGEPSEESIQELMTQTTSKKTSLWPGRETILFVADKDIGFLVYNPNDMDNPCLLKFNSTESSKCIKKEWKTVIFIHGWRTRDRFFDKLKTAYLALDDQNINLIEVNWKKGSSNPAYFPCVNRVPSVGKTVAKFIEFNRKHIDMDKLIMIGHSLGAHAAGNAGKFLQQQFKLTVSEIIGLDPAGIGFHGKKDKLHPEDARDVIVFHSSNSFGHLEPLGTMDIYINGGKEQRGCGRYESHRFSKTFYKDLVGGMDPLVGYRYSSFDDVKAGKIPNGDEIKLFHGEPYPPRGTLIYVGTQDQSQLKPPIKSSKLKNSVKKIANMNRWLSK